MKLKLEDLFYVNGSINMREHKYKAKCLNIENIFDNPELLEVK